MEETVLVTVEINEKVFHRFMEECRKRNINGAIAIEGIMHTCTKMWNPKKRKNVQ